MDNLLMLLCILAVTTNLPYCIGNLLFFFSKDAESLTDLSPSLSISIRQWLGITGLFQLMYILSSTILMIVMAVTSKLNNFIFLLTICNKFFHAAFQSSWLIIGIVLHWRDKLGTQNQNLNTYLNFIIIQFVFLGVEWGVWLTYFKKKATLHKSRKQICISKKKISVSSQESSKNSCK